MYVLYMCVTFDAFVCERVFVYSCQFPCVCVRVCVCVLCIVQLTRRVQVHATYGSTPKQGHTHQRFRMGGRPRSCHPRGASPPLPKLAGRDTFPTKMAEDAQDAGMPLCACVCLCVRAFYTLTHLLLCVCVCVRVCVVCVPMVV